MELVGKIIHPRKHQRDQNSIAIILEHHSVNNVKKFCLAHKLWLTETPQVSTETTNFIDKYSSCIRETYTGGDFSNAGSSLTGDIRLIQLVLTHTLVHSFAHPFTHSFIHSLIHSLTHPLTYLSLFSCLGSRSLSA